MNPARRILIVEDDSSLATVLEFTLKEHGYDVERTADGEAGAARIAKGGLDLALLDINLPKLNGIEVLARAAARPAADRPVLVMMTANASVESAVEAMKRGAADYLVKPFAMEELVLRVDRALATARLAIENRELKARLRATGRLEDFVGQSAIFRETVALLKQAAETETTVLLTGESGTGKELAARCLHALSPRADGPLVVVNCAAIPEHLLESELFGHVKGAFTGAASDHEGKFERADGGTLFFDEIGELALPLQAKLLRAIQEREIERVGSSASRPVDVRLVAATNADLKEAVAEKRFREDLFFRLNVFPIRLPSLRDRPEDLPLLVASALKKLGRPEVALSPAAAAALRGYRWPGNVRELEHALERALVLLGKGSAITPDLLPEDVRKGGGGQTPDSSAGPFALPESGVSLEDVERTLLEQALARTGGNQTRAAALLGLSRATLIYRMEKFGLKTKPT